MNNIAILLVLVALFAATAVNGLKVKFFGLPSQRTGYHSMYTVTSKAIPVWCFDKPIDMNETLPGSIKPRWNLLLDARWSFAKSPRIPIKFQPYNVLKAEKLIRGFDYTEVTEPGFTTIAEGDMKFGLLRRKVKDFTTEDATEHQCWGAEIDLLKTYGELKPKSSYRWILKKRRSVWLTGGKVRWFNWKAKSKRFRILADGEKPKVGFIRSKWYDIVRSIKGDGGKEINDDPLTFKEVKNSEFCQTFLAKCVQAANATVNACRDQYNKLCAKLNHRKDKKDKSGAAAAEASTENDANERKQRSAWQKACDGCKKFFGDIQHYCTTKFGRRCEKDAAPVDNRYDVGKRYYVGDEGVTGAGLRRGAAVAGGAAAIGGAAIVGAGIYGAHDYYGDASGTKRGILNEQIPIHDESLQDNLYEQIGNDDASFDNYEGVPEENEIVENYQADAGNGEEETEEIYQAGPEGEETEENQLDEPEEEETEENQLNEPEEEETEANQLDEPEEEETGENEAAPADDEAQNEGDFDTGNGEMARNSGLYA